MYTDCLNEFKSLLNYNLTVNNFYDVRLKLLKWSQPQILRSLIENVMPTDKLHLCKEYDMLDKIVLLHDSFTNCRLRLHIFSSNYQERIHNHKWDFCSLILKGTYMHALYNDDIKEVQNYYLDEVVPDFLQEQGQGTFYYLNHKVLHSITATSGTISLVIQFPKSIDSYYVIDKSINKSWLEGDEKSEIIQEKIMSETRFHELVRQLEVDKII